MIVSWGGTPPGCACVWVDCYVAWVAEESPGCGGVVVRDDSAVCGSAALAVQAACLLDEAASEACLGCSVALPVPTGVAYGSWLTFGVWAHAGCVSRASGTLSADRAPHTLLCMGD